VQEQSFLRDSRQYLDILRKRRGLIATCVAVSLLAATVYNYTTRPLYQATAQILIDRDIPNVLPTKEVIDVGGGGADYRQTQYHLLRGRAIAEKVVEQLSLQKSQEFQAGPLMSPWERFQRKFLGRVPPPASADGIPLPPAVVAFQSRLVVEPVPQSGLVNLRFTAYDPVIAAHAVNTLVQLYIEQALEFRYTASSEATDWLSDRAKEQQSRIQESERALQQYRERQGLMNLEERQALVNQKLTSLASAAMTARLERISKETLYNQMKALPPSQLASFPLVTSSASLQPLRTQLADLQRQQARLSETLGERHPEMVRVRAEIRAVEDKIAADVQNVIHAVETDYETARQQEASLQASMETVKRELLDLNNQTVEYEVLKRELDANKQMFRNLTTRSKETGLESELKATNIRITEKAEIPRAPYLPNRARNYQLALIIGLGLGIGLTVMVEQLDNTLKTPEDVKEQLDLPFLGMVADVSARRGSPNGPPPSPIILKNPRSALAESYRVVRTNIMFSSAENTGRALVVSSVNPAEGKSTTVVNVAASLTQNGARVLVIDADLRRPTIHQHFGLSNAPGLSDLIVGKAPVSEAVRATSFKGLEVLPCGYIPPNPAELLGSASMRELLTALRSHYDWILLDTPPILAIADTPVLSRWVDGVILVVAAERTGRPAILRTIDQLSRVGGKVLGIVLNRVDLERNSYYFGQYYGEYYRSYYAEGAGRARDGAHHRPSARR
jgi:capsular exopolysaccharide synthesis family protein